jgi:hypothetical protein
VLGLTNKHNVFTNPIGNLVRIHILRSRIHFFWEIIHVEWMSSARQNMNPACNEMNNAQKKLRIHLVVHIKCVLFMFFETYSFHLGRIHLEGTRSDE